LYVYRLGHNPALAGKGTLKKRELERGFEAQIEDPEDSEEEED